MYPSCTFILVHCTMFRFHDKEVIKDKLNAERQGLLWRKTKDDLKNAKIKLGSRDPLFEGSAPDWNSGYVPSRFNSFSVAEPSSPTHHWMPTSFHERGLDTIRFRNPVSAPARHPDTVHLRNSEFSAPRHPENARNKNGFFQRHFSKAELHM